MLHALIKNKLKDSIKSSDLQAFKASEDSLTSSIFGTMQYLHDELFWDLILRSCSSKNGLTKRSGNLNKIEFWPKWNSKEINRNYVEPDIFMQFDNFHLIIEAKKNDNYKQNSQYFNQWKKEISSYLNDQIDNDGKIREKLHFVAFGGNENLTNTLIECDGIDYLIHKATWQSLLNETVKLRLLLESNTYSIAGQKQNIRILNDVETAFNTHGFFCINWIDSDINFRKIVIDESAINTFEHWTTNKKQFFADIFGINRNNNISSQSINTLSKWMI